jgi:hypothetical protein
MNNITGSPTLQKLAQALVTFNIKVSSIKKDGTNPFFKSKYATLSHILDEISVPLTECGLVLTQFPTGENGLTSLLIHAESGEYLSATYEMTGHKNTAQERGSLISYQRRYATISILNLNISDESDDDGNAATYGGNATQPVEEKQWLNKGSKEFHGAIEKMKAGKSSIEALRKYFKISKAVETELLNAINETENV